MTDFDKKLDAVLDALARTKESDEPRFGSGAISSDGRAEIHMHPPIKVLVNPDGPAAAEVIRKLREEGEALRAELERLRKAFVAEREENLWHAYHAGAVKDGKWDHMCMSDGEWLAQQCGFAPATRFYDDATIKAAIPLAARAALNPKDAA